MQKTALHFTKTDEAVSTAQIARYAEGWLLDSEIKQHSKQTLAIRKLLIKKLTWFLDKRTCNQCGTFELRQFFAYITNGHNSEDGRWDNAAKVRPVRPETVRTYYAHLRVFFHWLVSEGVLAASPIDAVPMPVSRPDQIQPFNEQQISALVAASKKTLHPKRDTAIVCFLLDTGMRASELCALTMADLDMQARKCIVLGKGNKRRAAYYGQATAKALWNYLREEQRDSKDPLFLSDRGKLAGEPLTRSGLLQLIERLGKAAAVEAVRCSPHTFRHTFAISFLRNGGNVFTLQQILGHTSLHMTNKYVAISQGDVERQHRQYSPVDRLRG